MSNVEVVLLVALGIAIERSIVWSANRIITWYKHKRSNAAAIGRVPVWFVYPTFAPHVSPYEDWTICSTEHPPERARTQQNAIDIAKTRARKARGRVEWWGRDHVVQGRSSYAPGEWGRRASDNQQF